MLVVVAASGIRPRHTHWLRPGHRREPDLWGGRSLGYTDTSGTANDNKGLSVRRVEAVATELVEEGVPHDAITI